MRSGFSRRSRTLAIALVGLLSITSSTSMSAQPGGKADRDQITGILDSWERAWNSHDMRALAALFHEDGIWILWTGEVWKGRTAIEEGHAAVHKTVFRNSVQRERLEELTFVGPDAAIVRFYVDGRRTVPRQGRSQPQDPHGDQAQGRVESWVGTKYAPR